jgi:lysophospholipase L1-like esterase
MRHLSSIIITSALLFLNNASAYTQEVKWDSLHRPGNFKMKVAQFKSYPNSSKDIIFLGNSITAGVDWNELLQLSTARNRGISGDISFGIVERLDEVIEGKPAKVFILIGINDVSRNIPDSVILRNYRTMVQRIKQQSPRTKIYFQTLMPVNNEFTQFRNHYNKDEHILWINDQIKALGKQENFTVIDLYTPFLNSDKKLDKRFTEDGLHLNAAGYQLWASILKRGNYLK